MTDQLLHPSPMPRTKIVLAGICLAILTACAQQDVAQLPSPEGPAIDTNVAPVIAGAPAGTAVVGSPYAFTPTASDSNADSLVFSAANLPDWLALNTTSGRISGTPNSSHIGEHRDIRISVSDGRISTSLPAFAILVIASTASRTASVSWNPPTLNSDGSALTDLAGYVIYYGSDSASMDRSVRVENPLATSASITDLQAGAWRFGVSSYSAAGLESALSSTVTVTIP